VSVRVATYNIRFGGTGRKASIAGVLARVRPDIVIFQEATEPAIVAWIGREIGLEHVVAMAGRSVAAISREPFDAQWHELGVGRAALELTLGDHRARLFGIHLSAGLSQRGERRRLAETARLLTRIAQAGSPERTIIVGDFNAIAPGDGPTLRRLPMWIRILLRFDGGIRTEVMTTIAAAGFSDGYRLSHPNEPGFTMPAAEPSVRLDYVMLGAAIRPHLVSCEQQAKGPDSALASDHLALVAEFDL